ncbi:MAG: hypothetical protein WCO61_02400 [Alphaproteobacteria bacterium]
MAKGQVKRGKEAKKPKSDKNQSKAGTSAYKQAQTHSKAPIIISPKK